MSIQQAIVPAPLLMDNIKIEDYFVSSNLYFRTLGKNLCLLIDLISIWMVGLCHIYFWQENFKNIKITTIFKEFYKYQIPVELLWYLDGMMKR